MRIGQPFLARARSFAHSILAPMRRAADTFAQDHSALRSRVLRSGQVPTLNSARSAIPAVDQALKTSVDGLPSIDVLTSGAERIGSAIRSGLTALERATRSSGAAPSTGTFRANPQLRLLPG
jgi:hypothetical protein